MGMPKEMRDKAKQMREKYESGVQKLSEKRREAKAKADADFDAGVKALRASRGQPS